LMVCVKKIFLAKHLSEALVLPCPAARYSTNKFLVITNYNLFFLIGQ